MHDNVNEAVDVLVDFRGPKVRPLLLSWNGREYRLKDVNFVHESREGSTKLFTFSVSDDTQANVFKLCLNTESLKWHLLELYSG